MDVYLLFTHVSSFMISYHLTFNEVVDLRRFMGALKVQGLSRDSLPYKAPFQPFGSWFALISTGIITIFKGGYLFTSSLMSFKEYTQFF
jgi:amino acid permease